jgi:hypothetical protein
MIGLYERHRICIKFKLKINFIYIFMYIININVDLLPPVVAMHACIVLGLCEHDILTACDVESRR